jgi:dipeptidyl aminopeptidase/acylaminoacyl peptidase
MPNPFQAEDLFLYRTVAELECVSGAELAACTLESLSREKDSTTSSIWLVPLEEGAPWQFTDGSGSDTSPRWSPDGSQLAFLSTRSAGLPQIHLIRREGGEARQVTNFKAGAMSIEWCPDGKRLLATCKMQVNPEWRGEPANGEVGNAMNGGPKLVWRLPYKADGLGYLLAREVHLFVVDVRSGNSVQITRGNFEVRSASWSPDGQRIAFTRTREGRLAHRTDVWITDADGRNCRQLSNDIATTQYPKWSPDGSRIVFTGSADEGDAQSRLWVFDVHANTVSGLGDESIEVVSGDSVQWSHDSSQLICILARRGLHEVACVDVPSGAVTHLVTGCRQVSKLGTTRKHVVFLSETLDSPAEVYCTDWNGQGERQLTSFNSWWSDRVPLRVEYKSFDVPDGRGGRENIDGWIVQPSDKTGPLPLLVDVHGGPASYVLLDHNRHMYWPVLVSRGWAVLSLNPVGSSSYGREFSTRLRGHWGKHDLDQHLAAVEALKQEGLADARLAMTGKSYGGFMTAWAISHKSLLRAAVIAAPVTNLETHYGTSDTGFYTDPYMMCGEPYINRETSRQLSPMQHAEKACTPTLILQGEEDERCPKCQSEELFVTLMRGGDSPVEMVLYPGGSHHFLESGKPSHRVDAVVRLTNWVERWITAEM